MHAKNVVPEVVIYPLMYKSGTIRLFPAARGLDSIGFFFLCLDQYTNEGGVNASPFPLPAFSRKGGDNCHLFSDGELSGPLMWPIREQANKLRETCNAIRAHWHMKKGPRVRVIKTSRQNLTLSRQSTSFPDQMHTRAGPWPFDLQKVHREGRN